jgi:hypothetical protein
MSEAEKRKPSCTSASPITIDGGTSRWTPGARRTLAGRSLISSTSSVPGSPWSGLRLALCRPHQKFEFYSIRDLQHRRSRSAGPDPRENPYWGFTELGDDDDGVDKRRSPGGLGREASIASRQECELRLLWIETPGAQDDAERQEMLGVASARDLRSRMDPERLSGRYSPESSQSYPRPILLGPSARP